MPLDPNDFDRLVSAYLTDIDNPQEDLWDELDELLGGDVETSWKFATRVLAEAPESALAMIGVSILGNLLWRQPQRFVSRFETAIRTNCKETARVSRLSPYRGRERTLSLQPSRFLC